MSGLQNALYNLKFTAKQLNRQAAKATKDETAEKAKLKKVRTLSGRNGIFHLLISEVPGGNQTSN